MKIDLKKLTSLPPERSLRVLRHAAVLAILALGLMCWSLFDPRPAPVLIALSVGQLLGTASFVAFLVVVAADLRRRRRGARTSEPPSSKS